LYALVRNKPNPTSHDVEEAFDGNLCRCTGYRPILDAAQTFSTASSSCPRESNSGSADRGGCCMDGKDAGTRPVGCCKGRPTVEEAPITKRFTPPGLIEYNPNTELIFPCALRRHEFKPLSVGNKRKRWLRPVTLEQLLQIKAALPLAKVIGGSTETQIEIKFKAMQYSVSVYVGDIPELRNFSFGEDHLSIGGNITLTDLEGVLKQAIAKYGVIKAQPFKAMLKQLKYFAGRQIRNVGTPGGNLVTASPISDLNPVFLATNSTIVAKSLNGETEIPMSDFFLGYRKTALPDNAVIAAIHVPLARARGEYIRAYKQSKRKDDDIAIVNAALRVSLDELRVVESVDLAYGGMAPTTVQAKATMSYLLGKNWGGKDVLEGAMNALEQDFNLSYGVPGGMAVYRKSLAFGFFYRFWHDTLSEIGMSNLENHNIVNEIEREISIGQRDGDAAAVYQQGVLGQTKEHVSAMKQVTGEAQYTDDIPKAKNELIGCLVLSTKAHAKLLNVDSTLALELPGVVAYVDHKDLPSPKANWWLVKNNSLQ
jgi:xanthine dehydrogenase/oxidase